MAIRFATGWDGLQTSDLTQGIFTAISGGTNTVQSTTFRNGARALQCQNPGRLTLTNPSGTKTGFVIGAAVRFGHIGASGGYTFFAVGESDMATDAVVQLALGINSDGTLYVVSGRALADNAGGTVLGTSTLVLSTNTWYYIEFKGTINATTGSYSVRVNNSTTNLPSGTNVDTQQTANASFVVFGISGAASGGNSTYFDDVYFLDNDTSDSGNDAADFLGDVNIATTHATTGNGDLTDSTPSTGTDRGAMVDETTQDGDTTYNSFGAAGNKDSYNRAALGLTGTVRGIVERNLIKKSDAGTGTARNLLRIGTTNYTGATESPGLTYFYINTHRTKSPATSTAFTVSEIDAAESGMERVA